MNRTMNIIVGRAVIEQAVEALEYFKDTAICSADTEIADEAITDLRTALEQPEQEPVGWMLKTGHGTVRLFYTAPPQRKPLTDEEKLRLCKQFPDHLTFKAIEAIEAAHGIREET